MAAQGIKIIAKDLDNALAGLPMRVAYEPDEIDVYKVRLSIDIQVLIQILLCAQ